MILQRIDLSLSLKQKKRVTISDYSLVDNSIEISNVSFTPRDFLNTLESIKFINESETNSS
jgi:hypothetical protein